jgi:hypothetical protein
MQAERRKEENLERQERECEKKTIGELNFDECKPRWAAYREREKVEWDGVA